MSEAGKRRSTSASASVSVSGAPAEEEEETTRWGMGKSGASLPCGWSSVAMTEVDETLMADGEGGLRREEWGMGEVGWRSSVASVGRFGSSVGDVGDDGDEWDADGDVWDDMADEERVCKS